MKCPYCKNQGLKKWKGYCCRSHWKLAKNPPPKVIPCMGCGSPQRRVISAISKSGVVFCKRCKRAKGEQHYRYKEGAYIDRAGYRMVLINGSYYKEHRIVWQQVNRACLFEKGTIHHIRFDLPHNKTYNDSDNLLLVSDREHGSIHRLFDAGRYKDCFKLLRTTAARQLHYPKEIDNFIEVIG